MNVTVDEGSAVMDTRYVADPPSSMVNSSGSTLNPVGVGYTLTVGL